MAPSQLGRVQRQRARRLVDEPLHEERRFRPARAAVGADGRRRGERTHGLDLDVGDRVGARQAADVIARRPHRRVADARTEGTQDARAQAEHRAVGGHGQLAARHGAAPVMRRQQVLHARRDPLDRTPEPARQPRDQHLLAVRPPLHAEAAADVGGDHAHPLGRQREQPGRRPSVPRRPAARAARPPAAPAARPPRPCGARRRTRGRARRRGPRS